MNENAERTELIVPGPAEALAGLLGVPMPDLERGEGLPLLWHWLYLLERPPQAALGPDGHAAYGSIPAPLGPGLRRMFAGGRVIQRAPLRALTPATSRTWVEAPAEKRGKSGSLVFVKVRREISQNGHIAITEEQDIVYRAADGLAGPDPAAITQKAQLTSGTWQVKIDPVVLFRFSALTYNSHRIHYDREYARGVEGYPGLLVHGPLQAVLMAEFARSSTRLPAPCEFAFRFTSPLFEGQGLTVSTFDDRGEAHLAVQDSGGRRTASGVLRPA
jgi:3-methylfumaryl-CoA hydratase